MTVRDDPRASVLLPAGSDWSQVLASAQSVLDQTEPAFELVVLADGRSAELSQRLACVLDDPRVRVEIVPGAGRSERLSHGIALARGCYVKLLPAGDRLAPGCLARELAALGDRPGAGAVFCQHELVDAEGRYLEALQPGLAGTGSAAVVAALLEADTALGAGALADRDLLRELGVDVSFTTGAAELDLWLRLVARAEVTLVAEPLARVGGPRSPNEDERRVADAERAAALIGALARLGLEGWAALLRDPARPRDAASDARAWIELARRLLRSGLAEAVPFARWSTAEARGLGAPFPVGAELAPLAELAPELLRESFAGAYLLRSGEPAAACRATSERAIDDIEMPSEPGVAAAGASQGLPPSLTIAVAVGALDDRDTARNLETLARRLAAHRVAMLVVCTSHAGAGAPRLRETIARLEVLAPGAPRAELAALLQSFAAVALCTDRAKLGRDWAQLCAEVAAEQGIPVLPLADHLPAAEPAPTDLPGDAAPAPPLALLQAVALSLDACTRALVASRDAQRSELGRERAAADTARAALRDLARASQASGGHVAAVGERFASLAAQLDSIGSDVAATRVSAAQAQVTAVRVLDKLRLKHRIVTMARRWLRRAPAEGRSSS